jgi:hypothetical protein
LRTLFGLPLVLALALAPACLPLRPPVESSGPALSREGVKIAVTGQGCSQNVDSDFPGNDLVEERVEVQIQNATPAPLSVSRDAFRLVAPDGTDLATMTWRAAEPLPIGAGDTQAFTLRFMTRGLLDCTRPMKLMAHAGVKMNEQPIQLGAITFLPSHAL